MKVLRASPNRFFEPNANKIAALADLMAIIEPHVVAEINRYLAKWRETGISPAVKPLTADIELPFGGALRQIIANHCSGVARSFISKYNKAKECQESNRKKYQREILRKIDLVLTDAKFNMNLDNRVAWIEDATGGHDYMVVMRFPKALMGRGRFCMPIRKTKHMRDLENRGFTLKRSALRLNRDMSITLLYEKDAKDKTGNTGIGIDIGQNKAIARSDGRTTERSDALLRKVDRKKRGSAAYKRAKEELRHVVNRAAKRAIDWEDIDILSMENLSSIKTGKRWGNKSHHWRVGLLRDRILSWAEEHGVRVIQVNPAYTSQTCSGCGHCDKKNRSGERFICRGCGMEMDADINAAINIHQRGTSVSLLRNNEVYMSEKPLSVPKTKLDRHKRAPLPLRSNVCCPQSTATKTTIQITEQNLSTAS